MHKHPRKMVTYSAKNVNEETNSPSDEDFSAAAGRSAADGGCCQTPADTKAFENVPLSKAFVFCYAPARSRSLKIRSVDLLGDLLRTEIDDDDAVGFPGLPFIGVEID